MGESLVKRSFVLALVSIVGMGAALADDGPIKARQELMKANGEATKNMVGMLKGARFDLAAVKAALNTYENAAAKGPSLFPDNSKTGNKTEALPAIWENKPDVIARFAKLGEDAKAASFAITDQASFKATMPGVLKNCGGCHEHYKAKED
jgi:cytochrome c556